MTHPQTPFRRTGITSGVAITMGIALATAAALAVLGCVPEELR